jgi:hypothetical protein
MPSPATGPCARVLRAGHAGPQRRASSLREPAAESIETSALHIDIARDLKRIGAHIASVAYPILEQCGALRRTRLLDEGESGGGVGIEAGSGSGPNQRAFAPPTPAAEEDAQGAGGKRSKRIPSPGSMPLL